ncbi:phage head closure protein [Sinorhizobium meliloti]|uniref:phage head closure protein n=1 Tax=Rhizobium meliloti TaxID=382 RepID=UPI00299D9DFF|nr:phage head closure protein [Sinorhizobium meliloti]MDW9997101.1 phage head closure protein [Sinorhizobium meliloti]
MRAGRLDRSITIQRSTYEIDPAGSPVYTWTDIATVRAEIVQASTEEFIRSYGASDETLVIFRIRFLDGVTNADRVTFEGEHHNIKEVKEIRRRRGLELRTVRVAGT